MGLFKWKISFLISLSYKTLLLSQTKNLFLVSLELIRNTIKMKKLKGLRWFPRCYLKIFWKKAYQLDKNNTFRKLRLAWMRIIWLYMRSCRWTQKRLFNGGNAKKTLNLKRKASQNIRIFNSKQLWTIQFHKQQQIRYV